jgi:hypothetical protein
VHAEGHGAQPTGWGDLSADVTRIVMSKVALKGLARAAVMSREFNDAYLSRATAERAKLIALGQEFYGMGLFSRFVTAIQSARCGLCPRASLLGGDDKTNLAKTDVVITNEWACLSTSLTDEASKMINSGTIGRFGTIWATGSADRPLYSTLWAQGPVSWDIVKSGRNIILLTAQVHRDRYSEHMSPVQKNRISATLGLLLASCLGQPEALPAAPQSGFTAALSLEGLSLGVAGLREAEDLIAPLRCLAEPVVIRNYVKGAHVVSHGKMQSRPLGALVVTVYPKPTVLF